MLQFVYYTEGEDDIVLSQQLQVFLQVADSGSFAKRPSVFLSRRVGHEADERPGAAVGPYAADAEQSGVSLTAAGRSLYEDGLRLQAYAADAVTRAKLAGGRDGVTIRVGSSCSTPARC